jgi:fructose-specific phosphotransferase system IIC component
MINRWDVYSIIGHTVLLPVYAVFALFLVPGMIIGTLIEFLSKQKSTHRHLDGIGWLVYSAIFWLLSIPFLAFLSTR